MDSMKSLYSKPLPSSRSGAFYNTFPYPTKISPEAIAVYIACTTKPGDVVLDTFAGSGSTGIAALLCEHPTQNMQEIAKNLVESLTMYFGVPFISPPQPERVGVVRTMGGNLNIRRRPTTDSEIVGQIPNGAETRIFGETGGWYVTRYGNTTGYVRGDYIEIVR